MAQLVGKVVRRNIEVITVFKVDGHYYPGTGYNEELFESYLHTGDKMYLDQLEDEMEFTL